MMVELKRSIGIIINEDPQAVNFHKKAQEYVRREISYEELLDNYPSYLLPVPERVLRFVKTKISQIARKGGVVE